MCYWELYFHKKCRHKVPPCIKTRCKVAEATRTACKLYDRTSTLKRIGLDYACLRCTRAIRGNELPRS